MKINFFFYFGNIFGILFSLQILDVSSYTTVDTTKLKWMLSNDNKSCVVPATVPGGVYGSLMDAGVLNNGDFYFRYNDMNYRSFSYENWTYTTRFKVPYKMFKEKSVFLEFDGLDTVSSIKLNGILIGTTDNMFTKYSYDIKKHLKKKEAQLLEIRLESPVEWAKEAYERQEENYPVPPPCVDPAFKGECHANHIRKMQSSFGWDWGPAFPNSGIWKSFRIVGWTSVILENILFFAEPQSEISGIQNNQENSVGWNVNLKIILKSAVLNEVVSGTLLLELQGVLYKNKTISFTPREHAVTIEESFEIPEGTVDLWWPNGLGSQSLYNLSVQWISLQSKEISRKIINVGFRTVSLDQSFIDSNQTELGKYFRFSVNNVTLFLKGSNWIPSHVLTERMNITYITRLLTDATKTHQNCIRVWGGGIYESDEFYKVADKLGILIWQDFMFACSMYPATPNFLNSVTSEVHTQVHRLQYHPSIFVWAANNENEAALRGNWYGTVLDFKIYKRDYITLYVNTIRNKTREMDTSRPFVVSSPSNGIESEEEGFVAKNPYDNKYGDVHFYDYLHNGWDWKIYPRTRFASEYGFQSWPSFRTLKGATSPKDWYIKSSMMNHRQHHPFGNLQLLLQLSTHFDVSLLYLKSNRSFEHYLYLTQVNQAMSVRTETEFYRRSKSILTRDGEGLTSGALYWQLNDIWQGASWASIEFGGRWKMLHYFALHFFSPVLVSPWLDGDEVKVTVINDKLTELKNLSLIVTVYSYLEMNPLNTSEYTIPTVEAQTSTLAISLDLIQDLNLKDVCQLVFYNPRNVCFLTLEMTSSEIEPQKTFLFLSEPKNALLKKAHVQVQNITAITSTSFKITLTTNSIALFVWLETDVEGTFSDNGFLMIGQTQDVYFEPINPITLKELHDIQITTLSDTFNALHENDIRMILTL